MQITSICFLDFGKSNACLHNMSPAIPSEANGKPKPPQQGWRPGKMMLKLHSGEEGNQPQDRGSGTTRSPLPEVELSTDETQWEGALGDHKQKTALRPMSGSGHAQQPPPRTAPYQMSEKGNSTRAAQPWMRAQAVASLRHACRQLCVPDSSDMPLGKGCTEQQS